MRDFSYSFIPSWEFDATTHSDLLNYHIDNRWWERAMVMELWDPEYVSVQSLQSSDILYISDSKDILWLRTFSIKESTLELALIDSILRGQWIASHMTLLAVERIIQDKKWIVDIVVDSETWKWKKLNKRYLSLLPSNVNLIQKHNET